MSKEKLQLTKEEANDILMEDKDGYIIVYDNIVGKSRWTVQHEIVIKRESDGKFFKDYYDVGATESQDVGPYENSNPDFTEVEKKEKVIIVYE